MRLYIPKEGNGPFPVVIFSHGLGGSRDAAPYLGKFWSQKGYICIAVQHAGSDTGVWRSSITEGKAVMMQKMKAAANGQNLIDRAGDIKFVIDEMARRNQSDPLLKSKMDLSKIAVSGHSFGAGTSLAIAGQNFPSGQKGKDSRVKAAIYLCPPVMGGKIAPDKTYGKIDIPGMLITGTKDVSAIAETKAEDRRIPFDGMKAPNQYLINFEGADHGVFGGRLYRPSNQGDQQTQQMVDEITTKFLDATLKGDAQAKQWLDSNGMTSYLGKAASVERK
ncbi:MAG: hypothetical protein IPP57_16240 [Candidatus Obscuribacter sp.]|nr:hypothetical protein [Candidatus Obscuribacter sp.]